MYFNTLEDKCKYYQSLSDYRLMPGCYVLVHLDGRGFSKLIKNKFNKPFDKRFIDIMNEVAAYLCANVMNCKLAYVQSDEITLVLNDMQNPKSDSFFGYRINKMQSIMASMAASKFNMLMLSNKFTNTLKCNVTTDDIFNEMKNMKLAEFDCKVWNVLSFNDVYAWILFRNIDCVRNSKQMAAQTFISHKNLMGKNTDEQIELLKKLHNIDWNDFDNGMKYGRAIVKETYTKTLEDGNTCLRTRWVPIEMFSMADDNTKDDMKELIQITVG